MKLKFKHRQFQTDAVHAVVDLFKGQPRRQDTFYKATLKRRQYRNPIVSVDEIIEANSKKEDHQAGV